jgi:hypothetical protein
MFGAIAFSVAALACLAALKSLPYSSTLFIEAPDVVDAAPTAEGFAIAELRYDLPMFSRAEELAPLRQYFLRHCAGTVGLNAATCISDAFAGAFPHGEPNHEFVDPAYDPREDFTAHVLKHEPGQCVTRSGLSAATLLSVGIPARVVQLVGNDDIGDNAYEVWDPAHGWVLYDQSFGTAAELGGHWVSAAAGARDATHVVWRRVGHPSNLDEELRNSFQSSERAVLSGLITYPEPWLYTHVGLRQAVWPFRAVVARRGAWRWQAGLGQAVLRDGAAGAIVIATVLVSYSMLMRRRGLNASAISAVVGDSIGASET